MMNVETNVFNADKEIMLLYGQLVDDEQVKEKYLTQITEEYDRTKEMLSLLFESNAETRRPRMFKTLSFRSSGFGITRHFLILLAIVQVSMNASPEVARQ